MIPVNKFSFLDTSQLELARSVSLKPTRSGDFTYTLKGVFLHSRYDPKKEAARVLKSANTEKNGLIIIGDALGYLVRMALEQNLRVLNIDFSYDCIRTKIELQKLSFWIESGNLVITDHHFAEKSAYIPWWIEIFQSAPVIVFSNYQVVYKNETARILQEISILQGRQEINRATTERFWRAWVQNIFSNLKYVWLSPGIDSFYRKLVGHTAVVVAGGPSSWSIFPLLKKFNDRVVIIAVDTICRRLKKEGILIDFILSVDPQAKNYDYLRNDDLSEDRIIVKPTVNRCLLKKEGRFYFSSMNYQPFLELSPKLHTLGVLADAGSVGCFAVQFAEFLGCDSIYLTGMDLSFKNGIMHYRGVTYEKQLLIRGCRFYNIYTDVFLAMRKGVILPEKNIAGEAVLTDKRFLTFKRWLEQFAAVSQKKMYNLSSGLPITNIPAVDEQEFYSHVNRLDPKIPVDQIKIPIVDEKKANTVVKTYLLELSVLLKNLGRLSDSTEIIQSITWRDIIAPFIPGNEWTLKQVKDIIAFFSYCLEREIDHFDQN